MAIRFISPTEFKQQQERGALFAIDVRQPSEFQSLHVEGARLCPLPDLTPEHVTAAHRTAGLSEGTPVYVLCHSGRRARTAAERLARETNLTLVVVEGGTVACAAAGVAVRRGETTISLERQVRIAAGAIVVLAVVLGVLWTPWAFAIAGAVGAGLVVAGVTDSCLLGALIARMPWNTRNPRCVS
jgi:rhodanese-related sulfurtransferase